MDELLKEFHLNVKMHENAIQHAKDKGTKLNNLNVFMQPECWDLLTEMIENGQYHTKPTEIHYIDKKTGNPLTYEEAMKRNMENVREIYVMELMDRIIWNMFYQICYKKFSSWIHSSCKSYKKGESTRTTAKELSKKLSAMGYYRGVKHDLSKYFDSVPIEVIDNMLNKMEKKSPSVIWNCVREFYHDNRVVINGEMVERYGSLKQGCAFACLLADIILYDIDKEMEKFDVIYYRYSDDLIIIGKDYAKADRRLKEMLSELGLKINDKKTEYITSKTWFTFLGFRFKENKVTISKKTLKNIENFVKLRTIGKSRQLHRALTEKEIKKAIDDIQYYFFTGCEKHEGGMAAYLFGACNVKEDIATIDTYIKDCIRASYTNKCEFMYGLGSSYGYDYGVTHGKGKHVTMNVMKTDGIPEKLGWYSLNHMYKKFHSGIGAYKAEVLKMQNGYCVNV